VSSEEGKDLGIDVALAEIRADGLVSTRGRSEIVGAAAGRDGRARTVGLDG
jgi:hypothetical protein